MKKEKTHKLRSFAETIKYCITFSWQASPFYTTVRILGDVASTLITILVSFLGKYILDILSDAAKRQDGKWDLIALLAGLFLCKVIADVSQKMLQYAQTMHDDILNSKLAIFMMDKGIQADLEYFDNSEYHDKLLTASRDSMSVTHILWNTITLFSSVISCLSAFIILGRVNIFYGIFMAAAAVPAAIAAARYTKILYWLSLEQMNGERQKGYLQSLVIDRNYAQAFRLYHAGSYVKKRYQELWKKLYGERKEKVKRRSILTGILECLPEVVVLGVGIEVTFRVIGGTATVGDYSLYVGLVSQLWSSIYMLSHAAMSIYDNQLKITNLKSIEQFKNHVKDEGRELLSQVGEIELSHVSFTYPGTEKEVLRDVSFHIKKGEKIALVGLNGSGKSTLIKLLLRLYDPAEGNIYINGRNIREYKISEIREQFSVYFQNEQNYCFTLMENLTIAEEGKNHKDTAQRVQEAYEKSGSGSLLEQAPKGAQTALSRLFQPDGMELSGGQHQKVALARTFYRKHSALILDEPSSSLDPKAEHDFFEILSEFTKGKTTIYTSHRLSNVCLADRIIVLEYGQVVEDGTQAELLRNPGRYAELFQYQKEKFQVGEE